MADPQTPTKRRPKGTGSIYPSGSRFRAQIRFKGQAQPLTERFDTEAEAEFWLSTVISQQMGGARPLAVSDNLKSEMEFGQFMTEWLYFKYQGVDIDSPRMNTLESYEGLIRRWMIPKLGSIRMNRLHWDNIADWVTWLRTAKSKKTGKPLSKHRQRQAWTILKQALSWGVDRGVLKAHPIGANKGVPIPTQAVLARAMSKAHRQAFQALITSKGCEHAEGYCEVRWYLALGMARRQSECLALKWEHVHLDAKPPYLEVKKHMVVRPWLHGCQKGDETTCGRRYGGHCPQRHGGGLIMVDGTKAGEASTPSIILEEGVVRMFRRHLAKQDEERKNAVRSGTLDPRLAKHDHEGLVIPRPLTFKAWTPSDDNQLFKRLLTEAGIEKDYRLHDLRHTAVSHLVEATGNISIAKSIAGHATILTTQNYVQPDFEAQLKAFVAVTEMTNASE